jgi:hypothetical protein
VRAAVGEVKSPIVRTPAQPVRTNDAFDHALAREVAAEAIEAAAWQYLRVVHAARPEAALAVGLAVIEAVIRSGHLPLNINLYQRIVSIHRQRGRVKVCLG